MIVIMINDGVPVFFVQMISALREFKLIRGAAAQLTNIKGTTRSKYSTVAIRIAIAARRPAAAAVPQSSTIERREGDCRCQESRSAHLISSVGRPMERNAGIGSRPHILYSTVYSTRAAAAQIVCACVCPEASAVWTRMRPPHQLSGPRGARAR